MAIYIAVRKNIVGSKENKLIHFVLFFKSLTKLSATWKSDMGMDKDINMDTGIEIDASMHILEIYDKILWTKTIKMHK